MQRVDILIGIVIVLAAIGSAIGVTTYEDERRGGQFHVEWATLTAALPEVSDAHTGGGDATGTFTLNATNLTRVDLSVALDSANPRLQPTQVRIEVRPPDANATQVQEVTLPAGPATGVSVPFTFDLGSVPDAAETTAASADAALANLAATHATTNGTGEWTILVQFAPGAPGPIGGGEAHSFEATGMLTRYEANVRPLVPEVNQG